MARLIKNGLRSTVTIVVLAAVVSTVVGVAAYAWAADPQTSTIYAAVSKSDGTMKIVSATYRPKTNEFLLSWNQVGPPGPAGPQGPAGPAGATGAMGPQGESGPVGATGAVGPAGPQGVKGEAGAAGQQGEKGDIGPAGPAGIMGATGDVGARGPVGDKGDAGATWFTGVGVPNPALGRDHDLYLNEDGSVYVKDSGSWTFFTSLKGPQGDTGTIGPKGDTGATGPRGDAGDVGPTGAAGPEGEKGDVGPVGPAGPDGADGAPGPKGDQGEVGPAGPKGEKGDTGAAGPQGEKGDTGATGPSGADYTSDPAWSSLAALAPHFRVENDAIEGHDGPNIVAFGANFFTETNSGIYTLVGAPFDTAPEAPASVDAALAEVGAGSDIVWQATVSWPAVANATGYQLYRREVTSGDTAPWVKLAGLDEAATSYLDRPLTIGTSFEYGVSALDVAGAESDKAVAAPLSVTGVTQLRVGEQIGYERTSCEIPIYACDKNGATVTTFAGTVQCELANPSLFGLRALEDSVVNGIATITVYNFQRYVPGTGVITGCPVTVSCGDLVVTAFATFPPNV